MQIENIEEVKVLNIDIEYDAGNVRILNSHRVKSKAYMMTILQTFIDKTGFKSKRSMKSWIKEWKSHNRLYRLGLFRNHTADCDLEENEKLHRLIAYEILGR